MKAEPCSICHGHTEPKIITYTQWTHGELVAVEAVPADVSELDHPDVGSLRDPRVKRVARERKARSAQRTGSRYSGLGRYTPIRGRHLRRSSANQCTLTHAPMEPEIDTRIHQDRSWIATRYTICPFSLGVI